MENRLFNPIPCVNSNPLSHIEETLSYYPKNLFHREKSAYFVKMPDFLKWGIMAFLINNTNLKETKNEESV